MLNKRRFPGHKDHLSCVYSLCWYQSPSFLPRPAARCVIPQTGSSLWIWSMLVASVWTSCPCWSTPAHIRRPPCTLGRLPRRLSHLCTLSKVSTACCTRGLLIFSDKTTKTRSKNVRHSVCGNRFW